MKKKIKRHIRRGEGFVRDHIGVHRNNFHAKGAGVRIVNGQLVFF